MLSGFTHLSKTRNVTFFGYIAFIFILKGIPRVSEADEVQIEQYETLLKEGVEVIRKALETKGQIFVDTQFEFGYTRRL